MKVPVGTDTNTPGIDTTLRQRNHHPRGGGLGLEPRTAPEPSVAGPVAKALTLPKDQQQHQLPPPGSSPPDRTYGRAEARLLQPEQGRYGDGYEPDPRDVGSAAISPAAGVTVAEGPS